MLWTISRSYSPVNKFFAEQLAVLTKTSAGMKKTERELSFGDVRKIKGEIESDEGQRKKGNPAIGARKTAKAFPLSENPYYQRGTSVVNAYSAMDVHLSQSLFQTLYCAGFTGP